MQISRNELRGIVTEACDKSYVPEPDRTKLINGVEDADGVCFGSYKKKYCCPVAHVTGGDPGAAENAVEEIPELAIFTNRFDELMSERFEASRGGGLRSYNVDIVG